MSNKINRGNFADTQTSMIEDFVPEKLIKIYPYEFVNANKSEAFIKQNTISIASISQTKLDTKNEKLLIDKNGFKYFEMFASITSEGKLDLSSHTSVYGKELKEEDAFIAISNWYYEGELENIQLGDNTLMPAIFIIGEPFNKKEYENGNKAAFIPSTMIEAEEGAYNMYDINPEGLYEFNLINITSIEAQFNNARIFLTENLTQNSMHDNSELKEIYIKTQKTSLINSINAKCKVSNSDRIENVDLKLKDGLTRIKSTPIDNTNNLTLFMDWFDYDLIFPKYVSENFLVSGGSKLSSLLKVDFEKSGTKVKFFDNTQLNVLKDMILISSLYATQFSNELYRYTEAEAKAIGGQVKPGDIKGDLTVGHSKLSMVALANKDPVKVVDGIFETYLREYPDAQDSLQYLALKEIFAACSRYIYSNLSIGKGENYFNQIILPWYLEPQKGIEIEPIKNKNILLSDSTKWKLKSHWFDLTNDVINIKKNKSISKIELIQTDRKLTIPKLGDNIDIITKLPLPGDINTKSSKDLKYMWFLPFKEANDINKLFLGTPTVNNNNQGKITFNTDWTPYGTKIRDVQEYIEKQVLAKYNIHKNLFTIVNTGTREERNVRHNTTVHRYTDGYIGADFYGVVINVSPEYLNYGRIQGSDQLTKPAPNCGYSIQWSPKLLVDRVKMMIAGIQSRATGVPVSHLDINVVDTVMEAFKYNTPWTQAEKDYVNKHLDAKNIKFTFHNGCGLIHNDKWFSFVDKQHGGSFGVEKISERYTNVEILSKVQTKSFDIKRETLFDKSGWFKFLNNLHITNDFIKLNFDDDYNIKEVREIEIAAIWSDYYEIKIDNNIIKVPSFNKDDETIGIQRILFT